MDVDSNIAVNEISADVADEISKLSGGTYAVVLASKSSKPVTMSHDGAEMTINHHLANNVSNNKSLTASSLEMTGKYKLNGNNKWFNAADTTVSLIDGEVEFAGVDSLFDVDINVDADSKVTVSAGSEYAKKITVSGGKLVLTAADFTFKSGGSLILGRNPVSYEIDLDDSESRFFFKNRDGSYCEVIDTIGFNGGIVEFLYEGGGYQYKYETYRDSSNNVVFDDSTHVINYSKHALNKTSTAAIYEGSCSYKELYDFLEGIRKGDLVIAS